MLPFLAEGFCFVSHRLDKLDCQLKAAIVERGKESPLNPEEENLLKIRLLVLAQHCEVIKLKRATEMLAEIADEPEDTGHQITLSRARQQLYDLRRAIKRDMHEQKYLSIPLEDVGNYEQRKLFGPSVYRNLKSVRYDIREAGNCYALGRYTACVFHNMRVLEAGIRAFVTELNVKHGAGINFQKTISKEWGLILNIIQDTLAQPRKPLQPPQPPLNPPVQKAQRRFYSKFTKEFGYFKNAWRNEVMHNTTEYDQIEARRVMNHVQSFMTQIAEYGLKE
jgi:hypothetical protein